MGLTYNLLNSIIEYIVDLDYKSYFMKGLLFLVNLFLCYWRLPLQPRVNGYLSKLLTTCYEFNGPL